MDENREQDKESIKQGFLKGAKAGIPIFLGYMPLGFAYGVLAVKNGISPFWAVAMSTLVFAGAGQFIVAGMLGAGASVFSACIANMMVNLRHILMSAALAPFFKPLSRAGRLLLALYQTDEIFAVTISDLRKGEKPRLFRLWCFAVVAQSGWIIGTAIGVFSGGMVTDVRPLGLDYALTAMFIALLVPMLADKLQLIAGCSAVLLSLAFNMMGFGRWNVIMATVCGATFGLFLYECSKRTGGA